MTEQIKNLEKAIQQAQQFVLEANQLRNQNPDAGEVVYSCAVAELHKLHREYDELKANVQAYSVVKP